MREALDKYPVACSLNVLGSLVPERQRAVSTKVYRMAEGITSSYRRSTRLRQLVDHLEPYRDASTSIHAYTHTMEMCVPAFCLGKGFLGAEATQRQGAASRQTPLHKIQVKNKLSCLSRPQYQFSKSSVYGGDKSPGCQGKV